MHPHRLAARHLRGLARRCVVVLAVQAVSGLVRHQVQRPPVASGPAETLERLHPRRMRRAVVVAVAGDGLAPQLDPPARRAQRLARRVGTERVEVDLRGFAHQRFAGGHRVALGAEVLICQGLRVGGTVNLVDDFDPLVGGTPLGELLPEAQALGQASEDPVVVARLPHRLGHCGHGDQHRLRAADVVAFERRRRREHDVGPPGNRRPERLLHHDGLGPLPRLHQAIEVLMVMEGVPARPVHEPDVGKAAPAAVEVVRLKRLFQHLGDARDGDGGRPRPAHRNRQARNARPRLSSAGVALRAEAEGVSAARQADLAEHTGQGQRHPVRLLAVVRPLGGQRKVDERALGGHLVRQRDDVTGVDARDLRRPLRRLGCVVVEIPSAERGRAEGQIGTRAGRAAWPATGSIGLGQATVQSLHTTLRRVAAFAHDVGAQHRPA